ncbi:MAG: hypothetical protein R3E01_15525 [Pirellulaceae bacterium]|nr:hypothetical protein [Planctomycetales bacterium]
MESLDHAPRIHFSVDDVFSALLNASQSRRDPLELPFWRFLEQIHENFGIDIELYLFWQAHIDGKIQTLCDVSADIRPWLAERDWIRFGPHALDTDTLPHTQAPQDQQQVFENIYEQIHRLAGPDRFSRFVRLHFFSESFELADFFRSHGVVGLLTTDKPAVSYRLPPQEREQLGRCGCVYFQGAQFVRSQIRTENFIDRDIDEPQINALIPSYVPAATPCVVFTHEYELERPVVREATKRILASCIRWVGERKVSASVNSSTWKQHHD